MNKYTAPALEAMFNGLHDRLDAQDSYLKERFDQVTTKQDLANGRTRTNEIKIAMAQGGLVIISIVLVPILSWAVFTLVNIHNDIREQVQDALTAYDISIE